MRLVFTPRAAREFDEVISYLAGAASSAASLRVRSAIVACLEDLMILPESGRRQRGTAVRRAVVRRYPYLIYYRFEPDRGTLVILNIRHVVDVDAIWMPEDSEPRRQTLAAPRPSSAP